MTTDYEEEQTVLSEMLDHRFRFRVFNGSDITDLDRRSMIAAARAYLMGEWLDEQKRKGQ